MDIQEYERKKKNDLQQAIIIYALFSASLAVGCCIAFKNIIPFIIWMIASGYVYNKAIS